MKRTLLFSIFPTLYSFLCHPHLLTHLQSPFRSCNQRSLPGLAAIPSLTVEEIGLLDWDMQGSYNTQHVSVGTCAVWAQSSLRYPQDQTCL